jgi:hypothetical protein
MDNKTAQGIFQSQILSRWPDFKLTAASLDDWINLLVKYTPDDVCRAISQYVLNYDAFTKPSLPKVKEILHVITAKSGVSKTYVDKWPQFFLQQDDPHCTTPGYGTLHEIGFICENPDVALALARQYQDKHQERFKAWKNKDEFYYTADWKLVVCNDLDARNMLLRDRSKKNRPDLITKGNNNDTTDTLSHALKGI